MKINGIAILVVLFIIFLMSMVAVTINEYWLHVFFMTSTQQFHQQDKWILLGAEAVLKKSLTQLINNESNDNNKIQQWLNDNKTIHLDNVDVNVIAFNASGCFNINSLYNKNIMLNHPNPKEIFRSILLYNGLNHESIDNIISILSGEVRSGSNKFKNSQQNTLYNKMKLPFSSKDKLFQDISELRLLADFNKRYFDKLKILLCALPEKDLKLNINAFNSSQVQLLISIFPEIINKSQALRIINSKPEFIWRNINEFTDILLSELSLTKTQLSDYKKSINSIFTVQERYFYFILFYFILWIERDNEYYKMKSKLKLTPQGIDIIQRQYGISE